MPRMRKSLPIKALLIKPQLTLVLLLVAGGASASEYWIGPKDEVFGEVEVVAARYEDTFVSLARTYNVGYEALRRANPHVDPWLPGEGTKIVIPTQFVLPRAPNRGIVVNVAELRLYYFPAASSVAPEGTPAGSRRVITHPISIGRMDWSTPLGATSVTGKVANPSWTPPQSIREEHAARNDILPRVVPPGPDNPLGQHALRLGLPGYLIHGTNKPSGVGMRVTHGCIRMFPEDIEALFKTVPAGTPVMIVNQPYKLGWTADGLYLEAHPPLAKEPVVETEEVDEPSSTDTAEAEPILAEGSLTELTRVYVAATASRTADVRWDFAETVLQSARGVPEFISVAAAPVAVTESFAADPGTAGTATP
jgi:L,D-transpeptidase ErfK/SrfK